MRPPLWLVSPVAPSGVGVMRARICCNGSERSLNHTGRQTGVASVEGMGAYPIGAARKRASRSDAVRRKRRPPLRPTFSRPSLICSAEWKNISSCFWGPNGTYAARGRQGGSSGSVV